MTWLEAYMASLTQREQQIVILLSRGMAPKQIARQLGTSHNTVRQQIRRARLKADCENVVQLAVKVATGSVTKSGGE